MTKEKSGIPATLRKGVQASDPLAAISNLIAAERQGARSDKPRSLIESIRYVGGNNLQARDHALYEQLYAWARLHGIEREEHEITAEDMAGYLEIDHLDRIRDSISRILDMRVSYDFVDSDGNRRRGEKVPLLIAETSVHLKSGTSKFVFSIPPMIRRYVAASTDWTWLELSAFPHFKSKYSSTFYQRCALIAGYDRRYRHPWTVTPAELCEILGYQPKKFDFGVFSRDILTPVLQDVAQHVKRFTVRMDEPTRATGGRGRAVVGLTFHIEPVEEQKPANEYQAARLSADDLAAIRNIGADLAPEERPGSLVVGQAVTITGHKVTTLLRAWAADIRSAKANPNEQLSSGMQGGFVLYVLQREGVGEAFLMWAKAFGNQGKYPVDHDAGAAAVDVEPEKVAVKKTPPPIRVAAPKAPIIAPPAQQSTRSSLDGVREIIFPIDEALTPQMVDDMVIPAIFNCEFAGEETIELTVRHWDGPTTVNSALGPFHVTEDDLSTIARRIDRHMDSEAEFVR
jgi:hypothetical protein